MEFPEERGAESHMEKVMLGKNIFIVCLSLVAKETKECVLDNIYTTMHPFSMGLEAFYKQALRQQGPERTADLTTVKDNSGPSLQEKSELKVPDIVCVCQAWDAMDAGTWR